MKFYYKQKNNVLKQISPWHDIPLFNLGTGQHAKIFNVTCWYVFVSHGLTSV